MAEPTKIVRERPKRVPIGTRNVLTAPAKAGYVRRWVNDRDDRIERFREAGYEVVDGDVQVGDPRAGDPTKTGSPVMKSVGGGVKAYLMEIPKEWYDEDQKAKADRVNEMEKALDPKAREDVAKDDDRVTGHGTYGEGIKITRK
jgi:hypothetical protein